MNIGLNMDPELLQMLLDSTLTGLEDSYNAGTIRNNLKHYQDILKGLIGSYQVVDRPMYIHLVNIVKIWTKMYCDVFNDLQYLEDELALFTKCRLCDQDIEGPPLIYSNCRRHHFHSICLFPYIKVGRINKCPY